MDDFFGGNYGTDFLYLSIYGWVQFRTDDFIKNIIYFKKNREELKSWMLFSNQKIPIYILLHL